MSDDTPVNERRVVGWSPEPVIRHADIVELLFGLRCDGDANVPDNWMYRDRYLTGTEQALVMNASDEQWDDANSMHDIDRDERAAELQRLVRLRDLEAELGRLDDD